MLDADSEEPEFAVGTGITNHLALFRNLSVLFVSLVWFVIPLQVQCTARDIVYIESTCAFGVLYFRCEYSLMTYFGLYGSLCSAL